MRILIRSSLKKLFADHTKAYCMSIFDHCGGLDFVSILTTYNVYKSNYTHGCYNSY